MRLNHASGSAAEDAALLFLQNKGCTLLARNWHCPYGEIDLIVRDGRQIVFVEVKYRKGSSFGGAAYSITPSKLAKLQRSIEHYLQQHKLNNIACRLDAVLIQGGNTPNWLHNITG